MCIVEPVGPAGRLGKHDKNGNLVFLEELKKGSPVVVLVSRNGSWLVSGAGVVPVICINEMNQSFLLK